MELAVSCRTEDQHGLSDGNVGAEWNLEYQTLFKSVRSLSLGIIPEICEDLFP